MTDYEQTMSLFTKSTVGEHIETPPEEERATGSTLRKYSPLLTFGRLVLRCSRTERHTDTSITVLGTLTAAK